MSATLPPAKFTGELKKVILRMEADGIITVDGDTVALTEKGYEEIAALDGWSRDVDQEDVPCFMNERGMHEYSYAVTWEALCRQQGLVPPLGDA